MSCFSAITMSLPLSAHQINDSKFRMPSGNIWCDYRTSGRNLICDIDNHDWQVWGCHHSGCFGQRFILPNTGKAFAARSSDTLIGSTNKTLRYGESVVFGDIKCLSHTDGLVCKNKTGGYLYINREFFRLNSQN